MQTDDGLTLVIDGRGNEIAAWQSIATLQTVHQRQQTWKPGDRLVFLVSSSFRDATSLPIEFEWLDSNDPTGFKRIFDSVSTQRVGYVPTGLLPGSVLPRPGRSCLMPWVSATVLPTETACESPIAATAWLADTDLLKAIAPQLQDERDYTLLKIAASLEAMGVDFCWGTAVANQPNSVLGMREEKRCSIADRVLAIVPHYQCEQWLSRCLRSLLSQTRPPNDIVVVNDGASIASAHAAPATDPAIHSLINIVRQFPTVTLLAAPERVGPYRLIQQVIEDTDYWAYLFQDADDWSSCDRLQRLLDAIESTGAELVGTQELRVLESGLEAKLMPVCYPLQVNAALREKPGHGLLHPTSLVTRDLVMRLGGFATGLRFGGDTEFLLRAVLAAQVVNIANYAYFRRKRSASLTTDPITGLGSSMRQILIQQCQARSIANQTALRARQPVDLTPLSRAGSIQLRYVTGPKLSSVWI